MDLPALLCCSLCVEFKMFFVVVNLVSDGEIFQLNKTLLENLGSHFQTLGGQG